LYWTPLLSRTVYVVVLTLGVVVGVAGPILLWLNLSYVHKHTPFYQRVGYLLVVIGLGVAIIALALVLGEAARLERGPAAGAPSGGGADHARVVTGTRVFAVIGLVILLAGAFLLRPVEPSETSTSGGNSQGGGRGDRGG
jgi:multisubunit Na+/H+ antiporter MnhB subunit